VLAVIGLLIIGWLTLGVVTGDFTFGGGGGTTPNGNGGIVGGGTRTPAPSNVVVVDPRSNVPGSIVYVKSGNVWIQNGGNVRQLTTSGRATMPTWSPDGRSVIYIETVEEEGRFPAQGTARRYFMDVPLLMRIPADGSSPAEELANGRVAIDEYTWFHWLRQPAMSPDGRTIAVMSDGPNPTQRNVVLQLLDTLTGEFTVPDIPENEPLGHQDPAWSPDGSRLLIVQNGRASAARGAPVILEVDPDTGEFAPLTSPGYLSPSWSRDQRWIAATRTTGAGTDVVILDSTTGAEVFRITDEGNAWSPVWSPVGDSIAYFHEEGGIVDLRLARLEGTAPSWRVPETINLTNVSALEGSSRPGWFVPENQLPPLRTPPARPSPSAPATGPEEAPSGAP
jgi:dipeptidyl aminopeptidase/acylaminoacyl peptidase